MNEDKPEQPAVLGISGWHDCGKTVLAEALMAALVGKGLRVCAVKHAPHGFQIDKPGSDSARMWQAGAATVVLVGPEEVAVRHRVAGASLDDVLERLAGSCDLILVEGFKSVALPRIVIRVAGSDPLPVDDAAVVVKASPRGLGPDSDATTKAVTTIIAWLEEREIISQ